MAATFLIAAHKIGMPLAAFLEVGRHVWKPAARLALSVHSTGIALMPEFFQRGERFYEQGVQEFCRALLNSQGLPKGLSPADFELVQPVVQEIAEAPGLPRLDVLQRFAEAFAPHISVSSATVGIVYVVAPEGGKLPTGPPAVITEEASRLHCHGGSAGSILGRGWKALCSRQLIAGPLSLREACSCWCPACHCSQSGSCLLPSGLHSPALNQRRWTACTCCYCCRRINLLFHFFCHCHPDAEQP